MVGVAEHAIVAEHSVLGNPETVTGVDRIRLVTAGAAHCTSRSMVGVAEHGVHGD